MNIKTKAQFIEHLNAFTGTTGWIFNGENPFVSMKKGNNRLYDLLAVMAREQFGDDDVVMLEKFYNELPTELPQQVDFDMLSNMLVTSSLDPGHYLQPTQDELKNLDLFLQMMSKSSSFAHKAHKELSSLV